MIFDWSKDYGAVNFTADDKSKLDGIEAAADVTDATNVASAGAIMDGDFSSNGLMKRTGAGSYGTAVEDTDYQGVLSEGAFEDGDKTALDSLQDDMVVVRVKVTGSDQDLRIADSANDVGMRVQFSSELDDSHDAFDVHTLTFGTDEKDGAWHAANSNKLYDTGRFSSYHVGAQIQNISDNTYATITAVDSANQVTLDADIFGGGENFKLVGCFFTAPSDGYYMVAGNIILDKIHTIVWSYKVVIRTSNRDYEFPYGTSDYFSAGTENHSFPFHALVDMDEDDTLSIEFWEGTNGSLNSDVLSESFLHIFKLSKKMVA